jgi:uncharacterized membrane-anchored protein YitT (DUF2179 family)
LNLEIEFKRLLTVTLGSFLAVFGLTFFIVPNELVSGGLTGYALLTRYGLSLININVSLSVLVAIVNIPVMVLGFVGVSRKFVYYSMYSIVLQVFLIGLLENVAPIFGTDLFAGAIIGGLIVGVGAAITLKSGASLGGLDIVSQFFALKFNISVGYVSIVANGGILALAFLLFDPNIALYTLLMFVVVNMVVDRVHTAYKRVRLEIVTSNGEEVKQELISHYIRGITLVDGIGAYTGSKRTVLLMVTQAHEVYDVQKTILTIDPDAFISMTPVQLLAGKFNRVVIK